MHINLFILAGVLSGYAMATYTFPENLKFGFATASYQIEGGWQEDGKGENVWDRFTHTRKERMTDQSSGDIACDSYHKYKEDVQLIKDLGGKVYRFSLSWSRILPSGLPHNINAKGLDYYNNLIDELIKNDIQPMVTLFHWDLPQPLQDLGGLANVAVANYFTDFAKIAFDAFGDRVKLWITFNEPLEICAYSYGGDGLAPAVNMPGVAEYLAAETLLKAHAMTYHLYDEQYREKQQGSVGISPSVNWIEPRTNSFEDAKAAEEAMQFTVGWFAHPIFTAEGDYPEIMKTRIGRKSLDEGFSRSRLPPLDDYWKAYIAGTSDFFGLNHYTTRQGTRDTLNKYPIPSWDNDREVVLGYDPSWTSSGPEWLKNVPWGFRKALVWVKENYNNPTIYVTENGCGDYNGIQDDGRIAYLQAYLGEMLKAIHEDKCNISIYTAWSLLDNFEWTNGYTEMFGIHQVDFTDSNRKRTPKKSANLFRYIIKNRTLPKAVEDINVKVEL